MQKCKSKRKQFQNLFGQQDSESKNPVCVVKVKNYSRTKKESI